MIVFALPLHETPCRTYGQQWRSLELSCWSCAIKHWTEVLKYFHCSHCPYFVLIAGARGVINQNGVLGDLFCFLFVGRLKAAANDARLPN